MRGHHDRAPNKSGGEASRPVDRLEEAVRSAADGDEEGLRRIYEATRRRVFGLALTILRDRRDAEEAALSTFAQVWEKASSYDASRGTVEGWILLIARSKSVDMLRSRNRKQFTEAGSFDEYFAETDAWVDPVQANDRTELRWRVRDVLKQLPREQQQALLCTYFLGMSHSEAAEYLGEPLGTVKGRIRMGLTKLRDLLSQWQQVIH